MNSDSRNVTKLLRNCPNWTSPSHNLEPGAIGLIRNWPLKKKKRLWYDFILLIKFDFFFFIWLFSVLQNRLHFFMRFCFHHGLHSFLSLLIYYYWLGVCKIMCNNYYNVYKADGNNGSVMDGNCSARDGKDRSKEPVPPWTTTTRLTWFFFVYLVIVLSNMYI